MLKYREISVKSDRLRELIKLYIGDIVARVVCMHCWHRVSVFCSGMDGGIFSQVSIKAEKKGGEKRVRVSYFSPNNE